MVGLTAPSAQQINDQAAIHDNPCSFLFGKNPVQGGKLPIAIFSDYFCPYCAVLSRHLIRLEQQRSDIRLIVHELPLLGARSLRIAKVALAAKRQGKHLSAHSYLMDKVLRPGPAALRQFASNLQLDLDLLQSDAESSDVAAELRVSQSLASALGIIGTPGTMIGRTLIIGAIPKEDIVRLVEMELQTMGSLCP